MICRSCNSKNTRVTVTQHKPGETWRYCRCLSCNEKFKTIERYAVAKSGPKKGTKLKGGNFRRGANNPQSILTDIDVKHLRYMSKNGHTQKDLSKLFGISVANISRIVNYHLWKHVK